MTHYIIDTCADAFGKSFIVERCGNSSVGGCEIIHHHIDLFCGHPFTDILRNIVQQRCIDFCAFTNPFQLLGGTEYLTWRKFVSLFSVFLYFLFYCSRIIGGSKPESLDKVLHYYMIFKIDSKGTRFNGRCSFWAFKTF